MIPLLCLILSVIKRCMQVVAWGALFVGFLADGRGQRVPMLPFMVGTGMVAVHS
jgi:hypothetical protein